MNPNFETQKRETPTTAPIRPGVYDIIKKAADERKIHGEKVSYVDTLSQCAYEGAKQLYPHLIQN